MLLARHAFRTANALSLDSSHGARLGHCDFKAEIWNVLPISKSRLRCISVSMTLVGELEVCKAVSRR